jgi:hypothetical protein
MVERARPRLFVKRFIDFPWCLFYSGQVLKLKFVFEKEQHLDGFGKMGDLQFGVETRNFTVLSKHFDWTLALKYRFAKVIKLYRRALAQKQ